MSSVARSSSLPAALGGEPLSPALIPVSQPTLPPFDRVEGRFREVFETGMITTSKYVEEYERRMASYLGVEEAVAVSSNTTGMLLLFKCLGIRGEVILPSFTFSASGHALAWNNLKPVYVDIDPETCLMDPEAVARAVTDETSAIFGVHLWGNPCEADRLQEVADRHELPLVFDAAQAIGSRYRGRRVGSFGRAEVFSCSPTKMVTSGEGGIVATNDRELARQVRLGRNYGVGEDYDCAFEGLNARMSELHAILGIVSLEMLEGHIDRRLALMDRYRERLRGLPGVGFQRITEGGRLNGVYFSIRVDGEAFGLTRDQVYEALRAENIQTRRYYTPLHWQTVYADLAPRYEGRLPNTEAVARTSLTLPLYSHMSEGEVDTVCDAIARLYEHRRAFRKEVAS